MKNDYIVKVPRMNLRESFKNIIDSPYGVEILKRAWDMYNRGEDLEAPPENMLQKQIWQMESQQEWDLFINMPTYEFQPDEILPFAKLDKDTQEKILRIGESLKEKYFAFKSFAKYELVYNAGEVLLRDVL
ncbi:MAG: hypothetical protein WC511_02285 [Candidatus Pacearchaeota archaeon]